VYGVNLNLVSGRRTDVTADALPSVGLVDDFAFNVQRGHSRISTG
jgi:hypothetical protein